MTDEISKKTSEQSIALWCDGSWCYKHELAEYSSFMGDGFSMIEENTLEWEQLIASNKK